ncbi:MAG: DNA topoisomerase III, partial [Tissierellia bacterium]|nr:DNA topoisomerase III [Tissierellia bacterium]
TWALGHLVTLADPEKYGKKYEKWNMEDLPMLPEPMKLEVIKQTSKQFYAVKEQMFRKDVNEIVIATDAGREGELVARWIIEMAKVKKPIKRLWISSVTDKAIKEGFSKLKDGREYENLFHAAVARSEADWVVGLNGTRALTVKYNAQLSCGRVQTPTLAMIENREDEIRKFRPVDYYGLIADTKNLNFTWYDKKTNSSRSFNQDEVKKIYGSIKGKNIEVVEVDKKLKKTYAPGLYDLTELQRDANRIFSFSAKETLSLMQRLYENHKILTYPRTDSKYISDDIVPTLKDRIKASAIGDYRPIGSKIITGGIRGNRSFVDNTKVSDHHAIIPTEEKVIYSNLSDSEKKIYNLVVKRFLAVLSPAYEYEQTTIKAKIDREDFIAKGKRIISLGWKAIYTKEDLDEASEEDQTLPKINRGDKLKVDRIRETSGKTNPPAPFNEGTLLQAKENPVKYMSDEDKDLKKIIGETGGIGTVATRADIIEKLFNSFLMEKRGKDIYITSKGRQLLDIVPEELRSPTLTAEWEQKLEKIAKGKLSKQKFVNEMRDYSKQLVKEIKNSDKTFKHDNLTKNKCPECGKFMLEVKGKKGKMYVCQDRECGYRKSISILSNARCPKCKKKMELRGDGEDKLFFCNCGYREKLSQFNERKAKEKDKMSKKDVSQFIKKQKKEANEPLNTDLADALSKLKF